MNGSRVMIISTLSLPRPTASRVSPGHDLFSFRKILTVYAQRTACPGPSQ